MVQQQMVNAVVGSFFNMLFSDDSQARAQKQKMLAELQARQTEAERQKKMEEAIRLAQICKHLQGTLKLSGASELKLKTTGANSGGLQLKLGDHGEPETQNCDNKYLNSTSFYALSAEKLKSMGQKPCAHKADSQSRQDGLALKLGGDSESASAPAATAADPRAMTPQQLADLAQNLTPEQQQALSNALQASHPGPATGTVISAAPPASTTDTLGAQQATEQAAAAATPAPPVTQSPAPGSAFTQLHQTAAASAAATTSGTAEAMASQASVGFDTAGAGSVSSLSATSGSGAVDLRNIDPSKPATVALLRSPEAPQPAASGSRSSGSAGGANLPADLGASFVQAVGEPILDAATPSPPPSRIPQMSDAELRAQTCRARDMLTDIGHESTKTSKEMEAMVKEVEETRKEAVKAGLECFSEMLAKAVEYTQEKLKEKGEKAGKEGDKNANPNAGDKEKNYEEEKNKVDAMQKDMGKTSQDYKISEKQREQKYQAALGYLNALYEYFRTDKRKFPWVATAKCAIDFGYLATKVYTEQQQIEMMNRNLDSNAGALKAESAVGRFHKNLVDEALRRGMDPKTFCEK